MDTANSEITTLEDAVKADAKPAETKPEPAKGGESGTPVKVADASEDTSNWTEKAQKRYDELTRKTYEALGERDRKDYENQQLRAELAELKTAKPTQVAPEETFPTLEQSGYDESKYQAAVAAHYSKLATEQGTKAAQEAMRTERERLDAENAHKTWTQRQAEFEKSKPDYKEKALKHPSLGGPNITSSMAQIIRSSDLGPQVAYFLGENVEKSEAIARLSPIDQAREIGRIEAKLEAAKTPPPPAVSQAPTPVPKVEAAETSLAGISTTDPASDKLSDAEWVKKENARIARKTRRA